MSEAIEMTDLQGYGFVGLGATLLFMLPGAYGWLCDRLKKEAVTP